MEPVVTGAVVHLSGAASPRRRLAAVLRASLCQAIIARATRRALAELSDDSLKDIGLTRRDILFVADALDRLNPSASARRVECRTSDRLGIRFSLSPEITRHEVDDR
jgi:uncharacterized protein YjiS (DUF1127 family)